MINKPCILVVVVESDIVGRMICKSSHALLDVLSVEDRPARGKFSKDECPGPTTTCVKAVFSSRILRIWLLYHFRFYLAISV